jgi:hypothetical protein
MSPSAPMRYGRGCATSARRSQLTTGAMAAVNQIRDLPECA